MFFACNTMFSNFYSFSYLKEAPYWCILP